LPPRAFFTRSDVALSSGSPLSPQPLSLPPLGKLSGAVKGALFALGAALLPPPLWAQESAIDKGQEEKVLPRVVVSDSALSASELPKPYAGGQVARGARLGALGNQDLMDTPFNVTSYTAELIQDQQARSIADVVANDPAVRFTTSSGHMYENFRIRGFDVNQNDVAINGMFGLAPQGHVPVEFFERVEVLKGPSALFSGMPPGGGVGGVINLVPKRAADTPLTRASVGYQSAGQLGGSVDVGRRFGDSNAWGARVNSAYSDGDTELNGQSKKREFLSVALDYRGEALTAALDAYHTREAFTGGTPAMFWFANSNIPKAPDPRINQFSSGYGTLESNAVSGRAEYELNRNLSAFASLGVMNHDYWGFINGTHVRTIDVQGTSTTTTTTAQRGYNHNVASEAGLRGRFATGEVRHEVVLQTSNLAQEAGSASNSSAGFTTNIYSPSSALMAVLPGAAPKTSETTLSSLALVDTLSFFGDQLQLTLGVRNQGVKTNNFNAAGAVTSTYDKSVITPAVAVVVKPWGPSLSLYANYVQGLSKGDAVTNTAATNYGQVFAPYQTEQKEVGSKWNSGRFSNTASLFEIDKPTLVTIGSTTNPTYTDGGEKRVRGIEWTTFGEIARNVRLLGGATYSQGVQTKTAYGVNNGKVAVGVPRWQGNLGSEWDVPGSGGLTLSGRLIATSSQFLDSANSQKIPGWGQVDVGARYTTMAAEGRKLVLRLNVTNLFDRYYYSGAFSDSTPIATLGAARTVMGSATMDF
jgi:iron complex outermembrane receptor protein